MEQVLKVLPFLEILVLAGAAVWSIQTWRSDRKEQRRLEVTEDCLSAYSHLLGLIQDRRNRETGRNPTTRRDIFTASLTLEMKAHHLVSPDVARTYRETFKKIDATPKGEEVHPRILEALEKEMTGAVRDRELPPPF